jgi:hypothetical protein
VTACTSLCDVSQRSGAARALGFLVHSVLGHLIHVSDLRLFVPQIGPCVQPRRSQAGLVPRNRRRSLGRGKGSASELDDAAVDRAAALAERARQGRAMLGCHIIERFAGGQQLEEARIRAAFRAVLDRVSRKLAVDAGNDDRGWQARYDAARRTSRNATLVSWQGLIDAANETAESPGPSPAEEKAGARAVFRALADATETTAEELLGAFGAFGKVTGNDVEQLIKVYREAELAGTDDWDTLAHALSLNRYREMLDATSIEVLQRSAVAVFTAMALPGMITLMGTWPVIASRTGAIDTVPPLLRDVGPAVVSAMTDDPMWEQWGAYQGVANPRSIVLPLVMSTLGILMLPGMLASVEAYSDRLQGLAHQLTAAASPTET